MFNSFKIFLIIIISINFFSYSLGAEKSISDYVEQYGKAVVLIGTIKEKSSSVGLGSGFLVSQSGVLTTNYHVIEGAYPAMVKLINGDIYEDISVVDFDPIKDIAILKIKGWGLPHVKLGDSNNTRVGDRVFVIGNPKGLENTVAEGLLSAKRDISELISEKKGFQIHQISAPISAGSSGSPVFNTKGEVIGIATLTLTGGQNLNFFVPINYARGLISEMPKMSLADFSKRTSEPTFEKSIEAIPKKIPPHRESLGEKNKKEGETFLADNKKKEGVKTLPSGLQYKVIKEGTGKKPKLTDTVTVHYRGTFIDGTEFDSSYKHGRPASFPVSSVISGWTEALQRMEEGAKWHLFVPAWLAYGERGAGPIGPNTTVIFEVELLSIQGMK